jgi:hypothetical protein
MPGFDTVVLNRTTTQFSRPLFGDDKAAVSLAGAAKASAGEAADMFDAPVAADSDTRAAQPMVSAGMMTAERTIKDADASVGARKDIPKLWEKTIKCMAEGRPAPDMKPVHAMATLTDAKMRNSLNALATMAKEMPSDTGPAFAGILKDGRQDFNTAFSAPPLGDSFGTLALASSAPGAPADESMNAFFDNIGKAIDSLKENYLGVYEEGMQKNSAFYKAFLDATDLSKWMTTTDKNVVLELVKPAGTLPDLTFVQLEREVDARENAHAGRLVDRTGIPMWTTYTRAENRANILAEHKAKQEALAGGAGLLGDLKALLEKFEPKSSADVAGIFVKAKDEESAKKWAKDMGLPESVVTVSKDQPPVEGEGWWVTLDLEPVKKIITGLEEMITKYKAKPDAKGKTTVTMPTAEFQAWKVGYEAQATEIKNIATAMAQKMANAQSIYENLIKILTNTINSIMDMLKNFL